MSCALPYLEVQIQTLNPDTSHSIRSLDYGHCLSVDFLNSTTVSCDWISVIGQSSSQLPFKRCLGPIRLNERDHLPRAVHCSHPGRGLDDHQRDGSGTLGRKGALIDEIGKGYREEAEGYWTPCSLISSLNSLLSFWNVVKQKGETCCLRFFIFTLPYLALPLLSVRSPPRSTFDVLPVFLVRELPPVRPLSPHTGRHPTTKLAPRCIQLTFPDPFSLRTWSFFYHCIQCDM